jgi:hypothetical protein
MLLSGFAQEVTMRVPGALFALTILVPGSATAADGGQGAHTSSAASTSHCQRARPYVAGPGGGAAGQRLAPRKLTQLPPAKAYMAVLRQIGGCEAPLTMVDYRNPRRR